jgi:hypothetical protein
MANLRPLPQPHIQVVDLERRQGTPPWRDYWDSLDKAVAALLKAPAGSFAIVADIDGGGAEIETGIKTWVQVPFNGEIASVTALADQTGSVVVDIWKDSYANYPPTNADSITASAPVTIASSNKSEDTTLTGWTKTVTAGDVLYFNVDSVTDIEHVVISLAINKT